MLVYQRVRTTSDYPSNDQGVHLPGIAFLRSNSENMAETKGWQEDSCAEAIKILKRSHGLKMTANSSIQEFV